MNETAFFEQLILMTLYKKGGSVSSLDIETMFGGEGDCQNVNNVISNRKKRTSYIAKGYMGYDQQAKTISITEKGKQYIEKQFKDKRKK